MKSYIIVVYRGKKLVTMTSAPNKKEAEISAGLYKMLGRGTKRWRVQMVTVTVKRRTT